MEFLFIRCKSQVTWLSNTCPLKTLLTDHIPGKTWFPISLSKPMYVLTTKWLKHYSYFFTQLIHYITATADNRTSPVRVLPPPQNYDADTPLSLISKYWATFFFFLRDWICNTETFCSTHTPVSSWTVRNSLCTDTPCHLQQHSIQLPWELHTL